MAWRWINPNQFITENTGLSKKYDGRTHSINISTGSEIPNGLIKGKIIGYDLKKLIEVGLFEWPPSIESTYIQKVEADESGLFHLTGIENGRYTIIAIEGVITDVAKQLEKKNYAMLTSSFIKISAEEKEKTVELFLSEPLEIL